MHAARFRAFSLQERASERASETASVRRYATYHFLNRLFKIRQRFREFYTRSSQSRFLDHVTEASSRAGHNLQPPEEGLPLPHCVPNE